MDDATSAIAAQLGLSPSDAQTALTAAPRPRKKARINDVSAKGVTGGGGRLFVAPYDPAAGACGAGVTVADGLAEYLKRCLKGILREPTPAELSLVVGLPRNLSTARYADEMKPAQRAFAQECATVLQARATVRRVASAAKVEPRKDLAANAAALTSVVNPRKGAVRLLIGTVPYVLERVNKNPKPKLSLKVVGEHLKAGVIARLTSTVGAGVAAAPLNASAFNLLRSDPAFVPAVLEHVLGALEHASATGADRRPAVSYKVRPLPK